MELKHVQYKHTYVNAKMNTTECEISLTSSAYAGKRTIVDLHGMCIRITLCQHFQIRMGDNAQKATQKLAPEMDNSIRNE